MIIDDLRAPAGVSYFSFGTRDEHVCTSELDRH